MNTAPRLHSSNEPNERQGATRSVLVSIVVPVHNAEQHLRQCLASLKGQTYENVEIILVNDGSTDNSESVLERFASECPHAVVVNQGNSGAGAARNLGLSLARGEYVFFIDADDYAEIQLVELCMQRAISTKADMVLYDGRRFDDKTGEFVGAKGFLNKSLLQEIGTAKTFSWTDLKYDICSITTPAPWLKMYRRQFLLDNNLEFQNLPNTNDLRFALLTLLYANSIAVVDIPLINYRLNNASSTQQARIRHPENAGCVVSALVSAQQKLEERGVFLAHAQAFARAAVLNIHWNLGTSQVSGKAVLLEELYKNRHDLSAWQHPYSWYWREDVAKKAIEIQAAVNEKRYSNDFSLKEAKKDTQESSAFAFQHI